MDLSRHARWFSKEVELAIESNDRGAMCHLVEPLGAFTRGETEAHAVEKAYSEYCSYVRWLGVDTDAPVHFSIVQSHRTDLDVQEADSDILLDSDCLNRSRKDIDLIKELLLHSASTLEALFAQAELPDRVDSQMTGLTFYGERPDTIRKVFSHVNRTQDYYMSRVGLGIPEEHASFLARRENCVTQLSKHWPSGHTLHPTAVDGERWTHLKVLRRLLWHDRIHAKSIVRMFQRQVKDGVISNFVDQFRFFE